MPPVHFISAVTAQGLGGGVTVWKALLEQPGFDAVLHYSSLGRLAWDSFQPDGLGHVVHQGWRTYENRGYATYDESPRDFQLAQIPARATVVFDSIESVRQLALPLAERGCRLLWHVHSPHRFLRRRPLDIARDLRRLRRLDGLVFVSSFLRRQFDHSTLNRPFSPLLHATRAVVHNGVAGIPHPVTASSDYVLYFGRYDGYKNPLFLEQLGTEVRYAGTARGCQHPAQVPPERDLGWLSPDEVAKHGDIFVFPAIGEAFGLAVVEMMQRGKIVIAFRSGAFPETIEHGVSGFLIEPFDASAAREILARLRADPALAGRIKQGALRRAAHFSVERYREAFLRELQPSTATR
ncbi:MAG TPA: hypothetical protein DFS52_16575 [Myxococcales bacterium]|nr:hypothetical protein [Myxococcales bacterium]